MLMLASATTSLPDSAGGHEARQEGKISSPVTFPARRETVFDVLTERIVVSCKLPGLQAAAGLSESECIERVRGADTACRGIAREQIPEETIPSKERYERELKVFIDCLIPPTDRRIDFDTHGEALIAGRR
jgi:hypothetical protein